MSPADSKAAGADQWHNPLRDKWDKRLPRIAGPCAVVLFGVTGDLARKKVMPAIYDLATRCFPPPPFPLGASPRRDWDHERFAQEVYDSVKAHCRTPFRQANWERLAGGLWVVAGALDDQLG